MSKIYFVTSNDSKFKEIKERLNKLDIELLQAKIEVDEIQSFDIKEITKHKLEQAKGALGDGREKVLVDDRGFFVDCLDGFPGPFIKFALNSIKVEGLLRLMQPFENRTARFTTVMGYFDGKENHFFQADEEGFITKELRSGDTRDWPELLKVYGYKNFPDKALSELSKKEWNEYISMLEKEDQINEFIKFFEN